MKEEKTIKKEGNEDGDEMMKEEGMMKENDEG